MADRVRAFEVIIWQPIYHNGKFSHNIERRLCGPADTEAEARTFAGFSLKPREETVVHEDLTIVAEEEYIKYARPGWLVLIERFVPDDD